MPVVNGGNRSFAESPVQPLSLTSSAFQKTIAFFHAYKTPPQRYGSVHCPLNHVQHSVRRYSSSASASAVDPHDKHGAARYGRRVRMAFPISSLMAMLCHVMRSYPIASPSYPQSPCHPRYAGFGRPSGRLPFPGNHHGSQSPVIGRIGR